MPTLTPAAALAETKRIAATGIFYVTGHATDRMDERNVTRYDIQLAIASAVSATWQTKEQTWRVDGGADRKGVPLTMAVTLVRGLAIVTVY